MGTISTIKRDKDGTIISKIIRDTSELKVKDAGKEERKKVRKSRQASRQPDEE